MNMQILHKRFDFEVPQAGARIKAEFQLDKTWDKITGLALTSDRDDLLYYRGSQKIDIGGVEILPEGYAAKLLLAGLSLTPEARFLPLQAELRNGLLQILYLDQDHPAAAFNPYRVSHYLRAEK